MEFSTNLILDMALNIAGYLTAGVLSVVVYGMISNRRSERKLAAPMASADPGKTVTSQPVEPVRFVNFARNGSVPPAETTSSRRNAAPAPRVERADRADILRIAREMLKAGVTNDRIQRVLPVSETELELLSYQGN